MPSFAFLLKEFFLRFLLFHADLVLLVSLIFVAFHDLFDGFGLLSDKFFVARVLFDEVFSLRVDFAKALCNVPDVLQRVPIDP